jgi:outer membrane receptor protein involved in Fe transport
MTPLPSRLRVRPALARSVLLLAVLASPGAALAAAPAPAPPPAPPPVPAPPPTAAPAVAPAPGFTGVYGIVTDAKTGEPLIEATVKVVKGGTQSALTDLDGRYELALPPGSYELRIFYELHQSKRIGVDVMRGEARTLDVALLPDSAAVEEVVVEAKVDKDTETGVLVERKKAAEVSDSLSAEEIKRTPDSSASDAVKRVVSATVTDGKYVFVRGLGGRYGTTLLNGVILPSPEPDETAVPLDLFPAALLANLKVVKSYGADLPGSFSGGALLIETNSYPAKLELKLKLSLGFDSEATFRALPSYRGGALDWAGLDDGTRALPPDVPRNRPAQLGEADVDAAAIEDIGEAFPNDWARTTRLGLPPLSVGLTVGSTSALGKRRLGWIASFSFGHRDRLRRAAVSALGATTKSLVVREEVTAVSATEVVNEGLLLGAGLELAKDHTLRVISLLTHAGEDSALRVTGYSDNDGQDFEATRFKLVTRTLSFSQVGGNHTFRALHGLSVSWLGSVAVTGRDEPDTRDLKYTVLEDGTERLRTEPGSGERFYSTLLDLGGGGRLDVALPFAALTIRAGGSVDYSTRTFGARRFRYLFTGSDPAVLRLPPEAIFTDDTIGPAFRLDERTLQADAYEASLLVAAGYATVDVTRFAPVRVIAGLRYEAAFQRLTPGSPFAIVDTPETGVDRKDADLLPAVNLVYEVRRDMNFRASYSYTLARPKFRELAPFAYFDYERRRAVSGNPALVETRIHNADIRWELFPAERAVVATSVFYKYFVDPIEQVIVNVAAGDVSFANAKAAELYGLEIEARASFGLIVPKLADFFLAANVAYVHSEVAIDPKEARSLTSLTRPLQGQSPLVLNLGLGWETAGTSVWVLYNVQGRRLSEVGFDLLPDAFERPFHRLDVTVSRTLGHGFRLKLAATNLLNQPVAFEQGDLTIYRYRPGVTATAALEWAL